MKNNPYISVIIPLYNKEAIVKRSIQSVLNQSFQDFELIIVDDGSTDNSVSIVKTIYDDRVTLIQQANGGPSAARNTGAKHAKGKWIIFLDADDEMYENALTIFNDYSRKYRDVNMFLGEMLISKNGKIITAQHYQQGYVKSIYKAHANGGIIPGAGTILYNKSIIGKFPYNEDIRRYEDMEFLLRIYQHAKMYLIPQPVNIINSEYASASKCRNNISEDYIGHLSMSGSFWKRICIYKLFFQEHILYEEQCKKLYPHYYKRYDLYAFCIFLNWINSKKMLRKIWFRLLRLNIIK